MDNSVASIITVIGVIITAIVTILCHKHSKWCENVSDKRNYWLNEFREEYSIIVGCLEYIKNNNNQIDEKVIQNAYNAKWKLMTRLNTNKFVGNEYNFEYKLILASIQFNQNYAQCFDFIEFSILTNKILEIEWQKVKKEAKGRK